MKKYIVFLMALALAACQNNPAEVAGQTVSANGGTYGNITVNELNAMLKNKDFVFVNVHIPFEGDIAGTDLSIPYDQISEPSNLAQLPTDKDAKIILYCRSGRMSTIAAEALAKSGYTNIWDLEGGMVEWEQAGYPIEGR